MREKVRENRKREKIERERERVEPIHQKCIRNKHVREIQDETINNRKQIKIISGNISDGM